VARALPVRRYFLYGYYGQNNLGDDLLLRATIEGIRRLEPEATFFVRNQGPIGTGDWLAGAEATGIDKIAADQSLWKSRRLIDTLLVYWKYFGQCSWLVFGGGTVFHERTSALPILMLAMISLLARLRGLRLAALGVGVSDLRSPIGRLALRAIVMMSDVFAVRDEAALEQCGKAGAAGRATLTGDLVFGLSQLARFDRAEPTRQPLTVGVSVSPAALEGTAGERGLPVLHEFVAALLRNDCRVVLLSLQESDAISDSTMLARIATGVATNADRPVVETRLVAELDQIERAFSGIDIHCGMRFHGHVLAAMLGLPFIGISHDNKIEEICRVFDMPSYDLDLVSSDQLIAAVDFVRTRCVARDAVENCIAQARANFSELGAAMARS
jgi:polysaccharide pyruvyl transferase WcaK-like protein